MKAFVLALASVVVIHPVAHAAVSCFESIKEWRPREALRQKLQDDGWDVRAIKAKNGCYQAHGIDASGTEVDAYFDPKSFNAVKASN